jgi:hypothetical protein
VAGRVVAVGATVGVNEGVLVAVAVPVATCGVATAVTGISASSTVPQAASSHRSHKNQHRRLPRANRDNLASGSWLKGIVPATNLLG